MLFWRKSPQLSVLCSLLQFYPLATESRHLLKSFLQMAFFSLFLFVTYFSVLSFSASFSYIIFLAYVMLQARIILHLLT